MKNALPIFTGIFITLGIGTFLAHAATSDYSPLVSLPIGEGGATLTTYTLSTYLSGMIKLLIALGAGTAILIAIIGGTQYVASGIAPSAKEDAKNRIFNAFIGLTLILTSYLILNSINPELVNLKFELPSISVAVPAETGVTTGVCPSPNDTSVACCPTTVSCEVCSNCSKVVVANATNKGCGVSVCFLNTELLSKIQRVGGVSGWRITESWPPTVTHLSSCHKNGTCADLNNSGGATDPTTIKKYYDAFKAAGLNVLYESTDCTQYRAVGINCGSYPTMTNHSSFHVY